MPEDLYVMICIFSFDLNDKYLSDVYFSFFKCMIQGVKRNVYASF